MTLIIAGYEFGRSSKNYSWVAPQVPKQGDSNPKAQASGIFIVADSTVSNGGQTLLSGFRKVYPLAVAIWRPYFIGEDFKDYLYVNSTHQILIAFAGSTLSAQHYLNNITHHLGLLRITYQRAQQGPIAYTLTTHCDRENPLFAPKRYFEEDIFTPADMVAFKPNANQIAQTILHAIKHALNSAAKYKIHASGYQTLKTPFVAGIQCPASLAYKIFKFDIYEKLGRIPIEMDVVSTCISDDKVAVLGMGGHFDERAQKAYTTARASGGGTGHLMFDFLNSAIDEVKELGRTEIDRPSVLRRLCNGEITGLRRGDDPDLDVPTRESTPPKNP